MRSATDARVDDHLRSELAEALIERHETLVRHREQLLIELDDNDLAVDATQVIRTSLDRAMAALRATELALARVRQPDFGSCETCAASVPVERLRALPDTTRCAACASLP